MRILTFWNARHFSISTVIRLLVVMLARSVTAAALCVWLLKQIHSSRSSSEHDDDNVHHLLPPVEMIAKKEVLQSDFPRDSSSDISGPEGLLCRWVVESAFFLCCSFWVLPMWISLSDRSIDGSSRTDNHSLRDDTVGLFAICPVFCLPILTTWLIKVAISSVCDCELHLSSLLMTIVLSPTLSACPRNDHTCFHSLLG